MEMDGLFDPDAIGAREGAPAASTHDVQARIRALGDEHRSLVGTDQVSRRRAVAVARHRRRIEAATAAELEARLAVRRSLTVV